jgi:hypothetical protein
MAATLNSFALFDKSFANSFGSDFFKLDTYTRTDKLYTSMAVDDPQGLIRLGASCKLLRGEITHALVQVARETYKNHLLDVCFSLMFRQPTLPASSFYDAFGFDAVWAMFKAATTGATVVVNDNAFLNSVVFHSKGAISEVFDELIEEGENVAPLVVFVAGDELHAIDNRVRPGLHDGKWMDCDLDCIVEYANDWIKPVRENDQRCLYSWLRCVCIKPSLENVDGYTLYVRPIESGHVFHFTFAFDGNGSALKNVYIEVGDDDTTADILDDTPPIVLHGSVMRRVAQFFRYVKRNIDGVDGTVNLAHALLLKGVRNVGDMFAVSTLLGHAILGDEEVICAEVPRLVGDDNDVVLNFY